ncbi:MAG: DnaJ C-terminal domain-containing protein, partial [Candidatus Pacebacteria bacterium]|nr:DnaJ C-terminal domain-containing protein [Candidatus Paceibacterota bacterium]
LEKTKLFLKVSPGTESGKVLKITEKGIPRFSGRGRGDLYVQLNINSPKKVTKEQKKILEEMKKNGL